MSEPSSTQGGARPFRRKYSRFRLGVAIHVRGPGFAVTCASDDVGVRGCRLTLAPAPPVGTEIEVRVFSGRTALAAAGTARVAWVAGGELGLVFGRTLVAEMPPFLRDLLSEDEPLETPQGA